MLRLAVLAAGLGGAALIFLGAGGMPRDTGKGEAFAAASAEGPTAGDSRFRIWLAGVRTSCVLSLDLDGGRVLATTCGDGSVHPLASATGVERRKGGITLVGTGGEEIAEFAAGDGFAYEAVAPAGRLMALAAAD